MKKQLDNDKNVQPSKKIEYLSKIAPALIFGLIFLYWQGYLYIITTLYVKYKISTNLSDFLFQDILVIGINPILTCLIWITRHIKVFDNISKVLTSSTETIFVDSLVFTTGILILVLLYRLVLILDRHLSNVNGICFNKILNITKIILAVSFFIIVMFFLPTWAAIQSINIKWGYRIFINDINVELTYKEPIISINDTCNNEGVCKGYYTVILEGKDYSYLEQCYEKTIKRVIVTDREGKTIKYDTISSETEKNCNSHTIPKNRILGFKNVAE